MSAQPIDVILWIEGGSVQFVTSSGSESMVRVYIADADDADNFPEEDLEQGVVEFHNELWVIGSCCHMQEDTAYFHEELARIDYAQHLEAEYGPANQPHYDHAGYLQPGSPKPDADQLPAWMSNPAHDLAIAWLDDNDPKR